MLVIDIPLAKTTKLDDILLNENINNKEKVKRYFMAVSDIVDNYLSIKVMSKRMVRSDSEREENNGAKITLCLDIRQLPHYDAVLKAYKSMSVQERQELRSIWYLYNCMLDDLDRHVK